MERIPVISSNVKSIGYDPESATLEVEFNNGSVYEYYEVPEEVYNDFLVASSKGKYLFHHIKNVYEYARIV